MPSAEIVSTLPSAISARCGVRSSTAQRRRSGALGVEAACSPLWPASCWNARASSLAPGAGATYACVPTGSRPAPALTPAPVYAAIPLLTDATSAPSPAASADRVVVGVALGEVRAQRDPPERGAGGRVDRLDPARAGRDVDRAARHERRRDYAAVRRVAPQRRVARLVARDQRAALDQHRRAPRQRAGGWAEA